MPKFLKQLGFGNKKNPPAPPRRDYRLGYGNKESEDDGCMVEEEVAVGATSSPYSSSTCGGGEADHRKASRQQQSSTASSEQHCAEDNNNCAAVGGVADPEQGDGASWPNSNGVTETGCTDPARPSSRKSNKPIVMENYSDPADTIHLPHSSTSGNIPKKTSNENDYMLPYEAQKVVDKYKEEQQNVYDPPADLFRESSEDDVRTSHVPEEDSRPTEDYDAPWEWNTKNHLAKMKSDFDRSSSTGGPTPSYENNQFVMKEVETASSRQRHPSNEGPRVKPSIAPKPKINLDNRPMEDYDDPWDLKNKQAAVISALNKVGGAPPVVKTCPRSPGSVKLPTPDLVKLPTPDLPCQTPESDDRPEDQYDEPWELKAKSRISSLNNQPVHYTPQSSPRRRSNSPMNNPLCVTQSQSLGGVRRESNSSDKHTTGTLTPPCAGQQSDMDERPDDEYDAPWEYVAKTNRVPSPEPGLMMVQSPTHFNHGRRFNPSGGHSSPELPPDPRWSKPGSRHKRYDRPKLVPVGERIDPTIPLEQQQWYHGSITRQEAEQTLRPCKECSFLIRNSQSAKQDYSLSAKSTNGFLHMKIEWRDGHYILGQFSQRFNSIPEMIFHYSLNKLNILGAENMCLLYPVTCCPLF